MKENRVAKSTDLQDGDRIIVSIGKKEVGIFRHQGKLYAYGNYCLHSGGPACEGLIIAKVEERILADKTSDGLYFSDTETHFACPWHGYEYDIKTGECAADRSLKLRAYDVFEKNEEIFVRAN
jgi:nitrite reductase/ring-hydroxylating ferredoxin subunit